eukprot:gene10248-13162_t
MSEGGGGRGGSPSAGGAGDWEARKAMNITSSDRFGKRPSSAPGKARKVNRHMVPVVPEYRPFQGPTISSSLHSLYGPVHLRNSSRMRVKRGKTKQLTSKQNLSSPLSAEDLDVDKFLSWGGTTQRVDNNRGSKEEEDGKIEAFNRREQELQQLKEAARVARVEANELPPELPTLVGHCRDLLAATWFRMKAGSQ